MLLWGVIQESRVYHSGLVLVYLKLKNWSGETGGVDILASLWRLMWLIREGCFSNSNPMLHRNRSHGNPCCDLWRQSTHSANGKRPFHFTVFSTQTCCRCRWPTKTDLCLPIETNFLFYCILHSDILSVPLAHWNRSFYLIIFSTQTCCLCRWPIDTLSPIILHWYCHS